jgi:hypothetical protein
MSESKFNMLGNIDHLMLIEKQYEKDDEGMDYKKEKINLNDLLKDKTYDTSDVICTFDPMKTIIKHTIDNEYDSLNESLRYIKQDHEDRKESLFSIIKEFKQMLLDTIVIVDNFFNNFSMDIQKKETEFNIVYDNCLRSFDQIKTSFNEIIKTTEINLLRINKSLNIENLKSVSQVGSEITCIHKCNTPDLSLFNLVIDKITNQQKDMYESLKKEKNEEIEGLKVKLNYNDKVIENSKKLIEELYAKNQQLKDKLIKYIKNYELLKEK